MSVINQMLKDLDKRNTEVSTQSAQAPNINAPQSPVKIILITTIVVLVICLMSFYVWQVNSENNALKAKQNSVVSASLPIVKTPTAVATDKNNPLVKENQSKVILGQAPRESTKQSSLTEIDGNSSSNRALVKDTLLTSIIAAPKIKTIKVAEPIVNDATSKVTPAKHEKIIAHADDHHHADGSKLTHSHQKTKTAASKVDPTTKINKMSVSRRQLSAEELAKQKLAPAEKALASKEVSKAEKLLEDVVIITPNDSQTRKKLAALWFGRQAYQDAVNLLSQGIALNGKDSSLRLLKARIHLSQGQASAALNTLKPLAQLKDEQYQIMLANTAQQAKHSKAAVQAYKVLIEMKPNAGRWLLGLAVLYDKNSQFSLAKKAYEKALTKNDLSISSEQFVQERIQAIGQ